jgi:hypothetical protein
MAALGKIGGSCSPLTRLRRAVREDDELRERAKETLCRALAGEDVNKQQLDAARSLFAFRAAAPPPTSEHTQSQDAGKLVGLASVLAVAAENKLLSSGGLMTADAEHELFERLKARPDGSESARALTRDAFVGDVPPAKENRATRAFGYPPLPRPTARRADGAQRAGRGPGPYAFPLTRYPSAKLHAIRQ